MRDDFDSEMTDEQLELEMARREGLALRWGICVIVGLFVETIAAASITNHGGMAPANFAFVRSPKFWQVFSDFLIALGVFGEMWWNHQASNAREEFRQRANDRVSSAQRETERLKAQTAWRDLSREQVASIAQVLLNQNQPGTIEFHYFSADPESNVFARRIGDTFVKAKWRVGYIGSSFVGKPEFGLRVQTPADSAATVAVKVARNAFSAAKLEVPEGTIPRGAFNDHTEALGDAAQVVVYVGPKTMALR